MSAPPPVLAAVRRYLAAARPPVDAAALFDLHADQALMLLGATAVPRRDLARAEYLTRVADLAAGGSTAAAGPVPDFALQDVLAWQEDDAGGSLLARLAVGDGRPDVMAAFRLVGPDWRIFGACLHEAPLPGPAALEARILAEAAAWHPETPHTGLALTSLTASWLRATPVTEPILVLPEARFTCQNRGDCCRLDWILPLHANAAAALSALPWSALESRPPAVATVAWQETELLTLIPESDGQCAARRHDRCDLHHAAGWQPLDTCRIFPFSFLATPDGICVTTTFTCLTVGANEGQLLSEQETGIRQRLHPARHTVPVLGETNPLADGGPPLTWQAWRRLEKHLLGLLADRSLGSIHERLVEGHLVMLSLLAYGSRQERIGADLVERAIGNPAFRPSPSPAAADRLMAAIMAGEPSGEPDRLFAGGDLAAWRAGAGMPLGDELDDELITRYLRTVLFRKQGLSVGATFLWGTVAWAARVWERQTRFIALRDQRPIDRQLQMETAKQLDHLIQHQPLLSEIARIPPLREAFGDPATWFSLGHP